MAVTIVGNNTPTAGGVVYGDGTNYASTSAGSAGQVLQSNGSSAPSWGSAPSPTVASQAEMEAASSNSVFATPGNLNWHPGVAKAWLMCDSAGSINASYNIASITDLGTGNVRATYTTAMSSATYCIQWCSWGGNTMTYAKPSNIATTYSEGIAYLSNTAGTAGDPFRWFFVAHGDQ